MTQSQRDELLLTMNKAIIQINESIFGMQGHMISLDERMNSMQDSITEMQGTITDMQGSIAELQEAGKRRDEEIKSIKEICQQNSSDIKDIYRNLDDLQPIIDFIFEKLGKLERKTNSIKVVS